MKHYLILLRKNGVIFFLFLLLFYGKILCVCLTLISCFCPLEEMLDAEKAGLVERVHDLERQVLEHKDEIVCLKSTLAGKTYQFARDSLHF